MPGPTAHASVLAAVRESVTKRLQQLADFEIVRAKMRPAIAGHRQYGDPVCERQVARCQTVAQCDDEQ